MDDFTYTVVDVSQTIKMAVTGVPDLGPESTYHRCFMRPAVLEITYTREGAGPWGFRQVNVIGNRVLKSGRASDSAQMAHMFWRNIPGRRNAFGPEWFDKTPAWVRELAIRYPTPDVMAPHPTDTTEDEA